eukprot:TRINITY_DN73540_c0_g1_i2.p1 TRINITY_DN73540_c0_g1~~TRINITY_DN73540_c0_g1_i2.p1  ORF type:complete len:284 (+),score=50.36 TRINITY_DN73540_c0_g1_i2:124-975(+)
MTCCESDSDDLPVAPPESDDEAPRRRGEEEQEPPLAPPEEPQVGAFSSSPSVGLAVAKEVYRGSYATGTDVVLEYVRGLHPYWNEAGSDSNVGREVSWVRGSNNWVYGELADESFVELMEHVSSWLSGHKGFFVDLGCGTGKVGALASLHFRRVVGLEIQEELCRVAGDLAIEFAARMRVHGEELGEIAIRRADFLADNLTGADALAPAWCDESGQAWWDLADVAYACSPKYCEATMAGISARAEHMRQGALLVTVSFSCPFLVSSRHGSYAHELQGLPPWHS